MSDTGEDYQIRGQEEKIDLTTKPILSTLVKLAWPVVATMFVHTAFIVTDMIWVGRLGAPEMAAVISSVFFIWILFSLAEIVTAGLVAIIARHYGAKRYDRASYTASQAIGFSLFLSAAITFIGYAFAPAFLDFIGTEPDVTQFGIEYLRIRFIGTIFLFWYEVGTSIFRATGDTKTPMILSMIAVGGNILLDPCLIFGLGPFPELGVAGAAIATVITMAAAVIGLGIYLIRGKLTLDLKLSQSMKPDLKLIGQMVKIGLPMSLYGISFSIVYIFLNKIAASFGTDAIAALGIGNRSEAFSYMICFGFAIAVSTMVGQNLGAKKPERAEKAAWTAFWLTAIITGVVSVLFVLIPELITRIFISDAAVIDISIDYLQILALSQVFMAALIVFEGAFTGAGDTIPPMTIGVPAALARLPIAYLLCYTFDLGVNGIWWAITSTTIVSGIILVVWFRRGNWKLREIQ